MKLIALVVLVVVSKSFVIEPSSVSKADEYVPFPVVGVTTTTKDLDSFSSEIHSWIRGSYVNWIEQSGARFVPIKLFESQEQIEALLPQLSGVVIPGNDWNYVTDSFSHRMFSKELYGLRYILDYARAQKDFYQNEFPIMGICFGLQSLVYLTASDSSPENPIIQEVQKGRYMFNDLLFKDGAQGHALLRHLPQFVRQKVQIDSEGLVTFYNTYALPISVYNENMGLRNFWNVLTTTVTKEKPFIEFVSLVQAKNYPFFGTQFHPEKTAFEWNKGIERKEYEGVAFTQLLSMNFIEKCRQNKNRMAVQKYKELSKVEDCNSIEMGENYAETYTYTENVQFC